MTAWVVLSTTWKLEDVQAGLNVIITILCAAFIFSSSRFFWQRSARRVSRGQDVHLTSLLTYTTLGEVLDVIGFFKAQLFQSRYAALTVQCVIVVFFSLAAIFAGPISRYSTKVGEIAEVRLTPGRSASRSLACDVNDNVKWHDVFVSLENSEFPLDQLLDFFPENGTNWVYDAAEWNSTYTATCNFTSQTTLQLNATGNYTSGTLLYLYFEIPGLWNILSPRFQRDDIIHDLYYDGTRDPENGVWDDVILWQYVELSPANVSNENNASTQQLGISLASIYMKDAPEFNLSASGEADTDWVFGIGEIPEAYYTKVECDIIRNRPEDDNYWEAYPQIRTNCDLAAQLDIYWSATAIQPSGNGDEMIISIPSGEEILRFYQSWMISKDTYYPYPSSRNISLRLSTVELSVVFIVLCGLTILIVLLGISNCVFFTLRHRDIVDVTPETKVDWLLQSVPETQTSTSFMKSKSIDETWKNATFKWQQDEAINQSGLGKIQVGGEQPPLGSSSSPIPRLLLSDRPSDHPSYTQPALTVVSVQPSKDDADNEASTFKKPAVSTTKKDEKDENSSFETGGKCL